MPSYQERCHSWIETLLRDVRFGLRMLRKSSGYTAVSVLTLALGTGATAAVFSVIYGVLLRPLPYPQPDKIVQLWEVNSTGARENFAHPNFEDLRSQSHLLAGLAEFDNEILPVLAGRLSTRPMMCSVSRDFFNVMGVHPFLGRGFTDEEQRYQAPFVAVISYGYWKQSLLGASDLSSVRLKFDEYSAAVVGVMPPKFNFPDGTDIWISREVFPPLLSRTAHNGKVVGRIHEQASVTEARVELSGIAARLKQQYGDNTEMVAVAVERLRSVVNGSARPVFLTLLCASAFLLMIACTNVVNLMIAQATAREAELFIRSAMGAASRDLIRQYLTETLLLSVLGSSLGVLVGLWGLNILLAAAPKNLPGLNEVAINGPVLLFSIGIVFVVSVGLALIIAARVIYTRPASAISEISRRNAGSLRKKKLGYLLVAGQIATTLVLVIGTGLLGRSLLRILSIDPGFRVDRVVTMDLVVPGAPTKAQQVQFLDELLGRLRQIPGINAVGGANILPLGSVGASRGAYLLMIPGHLPPQLQELLGRAKTGRVDQDPGVSADLSSFFDEQRRNRADTGEADYVVASEGYFKSLRIPLVAGRLFNDNDTIDAPHVALVSESLAREKWPNQNPLGHAIEFGNMDGDPRLLTVVGVVGDTCGQSLETPPEPTIYVNYRQRPEGTQRFTVVLSSSGRPDTVISAARGILRSLDEDTPPRFGSLTEALGASLESRRFALTVVGIFSSIALLLAIVGIFGVTSYSVAQRTHEIGVRMALGASTRNVLALILGEAVSAGGVGVAAGFVASLVVMRLMKSQLFGVTSADPLTFIGTTILLLFVSFVASWIPARRATRVDPTVTLSYE